MTTEKIFGYTAQGEAVKAFTLQSGAVSATILEYGCAIQSLVVTLADGEQRDIVLGYDTVSGYEAGESGQGSLIGRYANRIKGAEFELCGKKYLLQKNSGNNHLHGAFSHSLYKGTATEDGVVFKGYSPDMEDGFPGSMTLEVEYSLSAEGAVKISYKAQADADTLINLTNHSYFNLDGQAFGSALEHTLWLNCKSFCEADAETCTTGEILPVSGTPMDFTQAKAIGRDINADYIQITQALGYDHNFIIDKGENELAICAMAKSGDGKIILEAYTTQPGVQLYTANYLNELGKGNKKHSPRDAFCLETQHYPCSVSYAHFPTTILKKGDLFESTTIYKVFEVK